MTNQNAVFSVKYSAADSIPGSQYKVELIGQDTFIHFKHSDGRPITVTGAPIEIALQIVVASHAGKKVTVRHTAKQLMDVGEATEHWCARYLECSFV